MKFVSLLTLNYRSLVYQRRFDSYFVLIRSQSIMPIVYFYKIPSKQAFYVPFAYRT